MLWKIIYKYDEALSICVCFLSAMLYVAPEILRKCHLSNHSLQKADVYSFAIVVQEILVRAGPFPLEGGVEITFEGEILFSIEQQRINFYVIIITCLSIHVPV